MCPAASENTFSTRKLQKGQWISRRVSAADCLRESDSLRDTSGESLRGALAFLIFFIAETKGTMESLELRPIEQAKISCAKKLFNEMSTSNVVYHDVDSYQSLLNIINSI